VSGWRSAVAKLSHLADERAKDMAPIVADIVKGGVTSHRGIAIELNERGIPSARGRQWSEFQVARLRRRLGVLAERRIVGDASGLELPPESRRERTRGLP
jgi:hypothetical protein